MYYYKHLCKRENRHFEDSKMEKPHFQKCKAVKPLLHLLSMVQGYRIYIKICQIYVLLSISHPSEISENLRVVAWSRFSKSTSLLKIAENENETGLDINLNVVFAFKNVRSLVKFSWMSILIWLRAIAEWSAFILQSNFWKPTWNVVELHLWITDFKFVACTVSGAIDHVICRWGHNTPSCLKNHIGAISNGEYKQSPCDSCNPWYVLSCLIG